MPARVQIHSASGNLLNKICQIIYYLYRTKEKVYNNTMNSINSKNSKTSEPRKLLLNVADK